MTQDARAQYHAQIVTVARAMFTNYLPEREWTNPLFQVDRDNCLLLAAQFRDIFLQGIQIEPVQLWAIPSEAGIDDRWRQAFVAGKIAEVLAELSAGVPLKSLDALDRAWVREQADITVDAAIDRFQKPVTDDGSHYEPHREYEPDVDFDGRTAAEANR